MPAPPAGGADDSSHRYYNIPVPSWKAIPNDYERDNDDDEKDEIVKRGEILVIEAGWPNIKRNNTI